MTIDIQRTVIKTQLRRFITIIVFTLMIVIIILGGDRRNDFLGMDKYEWAMIAGAVYLLISIAESILELNYIYFSNEGDKIVLRYFSMSFFNKKKNSIEIARERFRGYILKKSLGGLKKKIILIQLIKNVDAKYPPVSLSALNKEQLSGLLTALDRYK
jgi:hypothetical protein